MDQLSTRTDYEFGGFRLDTILQVLVSPAGEVVALPARAYDALLCLVERAGELVDRASLMRAVWPNTVVEDNNLNQCILTLRRALGESAGERRFILTVPGRGFKFVAPVTTMPPRRDTQPPRPWPGSTSREPPTPEPASASVHAPTPAPTVAPAPTSTPTRPATPSSAPRGRPSRRRLVFAGSTLLAVIIAAVVLTLFARSRPVTVATEYEPLTDLGESATAPALSRDGKMLAFIRGGAAFLGTGRIYVKPLPDGEPQPLTKMLAEIYAPAFTYDGTSVAFTYFTNGKSLPAWNTLTVPTTGGLPTLLLGNSAGLTWIGPHQVLYSEIKEGARLGVVTSTDDRADRREIYFPAHERGMAHYSYLSPDRRSVLVVEMDRTGSWRRCRLVPFDGSSAGEQVGPRGRCTAAAWSPDGEWMYFSAIVDGHSHLWRQRFPHGKPEQITFGPTEEEGVAVEPDGRSLVTSLGLVQQSIWMHDGSGERRITSEAATSSPWLSSDAKRLYFLAAHASDAASSLWRLDIQQGQEEPVLPGFDVASYDISRDEREVVFSVDHDGEQQIWTAPLDHHLPPRLLARGADEPAFGGGHVFFRLLGDKVNYLYRMQDDGSSKQRVLDTPILQILSVSPTGRWVVVLTVVAGEVSTAILGVRPGTFRWVRSGYWATRWSPDGTALYLEVGGASPNTADRTLRIALTGDAPPQIPAHPEDAEDAILPHAPEGFVPSGDPAVYVFTQREWLRNIYRIPLHR